MRRLPVITDKSDFYRRSRNLELGNVLRQWPWPEFYRLAMTEPEVLPRRVGVRHLNFAANKNTRKMTVKEALRYGLSCPDPRYIQVDEGAPDHCLTLQGEVMLDPRSLCLRYNAGLRIHFRAALTQDADQSQPPVFKHAFGLEANHLIRRYMDVDSWEKLNEILRGYYNAIVEFTCFERAVGILGWNTLFWEVRCRQ